MADDQKKLVTALHEALTKVATAKAALDAKATEVEAASAAYQEAVATATTAHDQFAAHVGTILPIVPR